ncbi:MAG: class I SAM-dependent methyltransferase [bacterium]|nr:class I SAM-dependent methyltransferase [bacterium]
MACFICNNTSLIKFLDLGDQPPSDAFLRQADLDKPEVRYPLALHLCEECGLVQLGCVVDPDLLFKDYVYTTGTNNSLLENFKSLVKNLVSRFNVKEGDLVVDVGSNDGTLLSQYAPYTKNILGVDPSSAALLAEKRGIRTIHDFFTEAVAVSIKEKHGAAKVITATNVFAHVAELNSFMRGITLLLSEDGVFVSESGYLLDMVETLGYDAVYHEHLRYYSLRPLIRLFETFGMEITHVERIPSHSGSIRVYAARKGTQKTSPSVAELLALEQEKGLYAKETFIRFAKLVFAHRTALLKLLAESKKSGKVVGIGAPAKGNTLLNFCGITRTIVESILEKSELKIGLYTPGTHIPVVSEETLFSLRPDYALILSWNLCEELIKKLCEKGYRGAFIIPFPTPRLITEPV